MELKGPEAGLAMHNVTQHQARTPTHQFAVQYAVLLSEAAPKSSG
jgi:hypothetical protein